MQLSELIRTRRNTPPASMSLELIPKAQIEQILEQANYAPNHKMTQPWRFRVLVGEKKAALGQLLAEVYTQNTPVEKFSQVQYNKYLNNPSKGSHIIAIGVHLDPEKRLPEWEEITAVAMSVQNMWLTAHDLGLAGFWSSPKAIESEPVKAFLQFGAQEKCLGFFYVGYPTVALPEPARTSMEDKVLWL